MRLMVPIMQSSLNNQHHESSLQYAKKILVADDSIALRKMLVQMLISIGYDITEAVDGTLLGVLLTLGTNVKSPY